MKNVVTYILYPFVNLQKFGILMSIWYILWAFGMFCGQLVYFSIFGMLCREKSGNPDRDGKANSARIARFFLVQRTKTGENIPNNHKIYHMTTKYTKWLYNRPNVH
jgi:hypothetical protein